MKSYKKWVLQNTDGTMGVYLAMYQQFVCLEDIPADVFNFYSENSFEDLISYFKDAPHPISDSITMMMAVYI